MTTAEDRAFPVVAERDDDPHGNPETAEEDGQETVQDVVGSCFGLGVNGVSTTVGTNHGSGPFAAFWDFSFGVFISFTTSSKAAVSRAT